MRPDAERQNSAEEPHDAFQRIVNACWRPGRKLLTVTVLSSAVVILAAVLPSLSRRAEEPASAPPEVIGMWKTDAPAYQGKYLKIEEKFLATKFSDDELPSIQRINRIKKVQSGPISDYTIFYADQSEGEGQLTVEINAKSPDQMSLRNERGPVWTRESP